MGIYLLNSFLKSLSNNGSRKLDLSELSGKKIVIDTSIYLYRFKAMNALLENMYLLCTILRYYNISALFIFDGKANEVKNTTLKKRKEERFQAKEAYYECKNRLKDCNDEEKEIIEDQMNILRKKFVRITRRDMINVKELLDNYGMMYFEAKGEADQLCASLVINGHAYACLSEDTDLFAYGCPRVLKYISLMKHTVILYPIGDILRSINMSFEHFQQLCILSGTDYNNSHRSIFKFYSLYRKYLKNNSRKNFMVWLQDKRYISMQTFYEIKDIYEIYNKNPNEILEEMNYLLIKNKSICFNGVKSVLENENFIFAY